MVSDAEERKFHSSLLSVGTTFTPPYIEALSDDQPQLEHQTQRERLLASLRGQTVRIPDLTPLFELWPTKTNPEMDRMRTDIQAWLNSTIPPGKVLAALQASDFGLFGALWYPHADFHKMQISTYMAVWLFTWDDEIDLNDSTMWKEFGAAQVYRDQTLAYVRYTLGMDKDCPEVYHRVIFNFAPIGAALKKHYTLDQRKMVYEEIRFFMEMSEHEQRLRLSGTIPSIDEYWHYRLGSSAVNVCVVMNEFCMGASLPLEFHSDSDMKDLVRYTNTIISATNDLVSVKKEVKRDAIESLVPITFFHVGDMQTAVREVVTFITTEMKNMEEAAASLIRRYEAADGDKRRLLKDYIDCCKYYVTGNWAWSLKSDRYGINLIDGEIVINL